MKLLPRRAWLFSFNSFVAAMCALGIGLWMDLPRPSWAMMTAYIVSQPLSGALRSRAVYRIAGTFLGAAMAVFLVPRLVNAPELLVLGVCLWGAVCIYFGYLDRTPRSYLFVLAGYTTAIIVFPGVSQPGEVFLTATARVTEITLGIVCATLVHGVLFPRAVTPVLNARIDRFIEDAQAWTLDALTGRSDEGARRDWRALASDVAELRTLSTHVPFDTSRLRPTTRAVQALQERMASLLPILASVEDRLRALREEGRPLEPAVSNLLGELTVWVRAGPEPQVAEASRLREACAALAPGVRAGSDWRTLIISSLAARLGELVEVLRDCRGLRIAISDPARKPPVHLAPLLLSRPQLPLHRDHTMALLSGLASVVAISAVCTFWIATAWPDGGLAAMIATIFTSLFATKDDPVPIIFTETVANSLAYVLGGVYLFGVLPAITGFPMLVLVLAPVLLVSGAFMSQPRWVGRATPFTMGLVVTLSLERTFRPDFEVFANGVLAQWVGFMAAALATRFFRTFRVDSLSRSLLKTGWRDLARMATPGARPDRRQWAALALDRMGLLAARMAQPSHGDLPEAEGAAQGLRMGLNVIALHRALPALRPEAHAAVTRLLILLASHFSERAHGRQQTPPAKLQSSMDAALAHTAGTDDPRATSAVQALVGLRRGLFRDAAPYLPPVPVEAPA